MSLELTVLHLVLRLSVVYRRRELVITTLDGMQWCQVALDRRRIKVQIAMGHITMERLTVEFMILTRPMISVNDRRLVIVPAGVETITFKSPVHQVRVGKLVLSPI